MEKRKFIENIWNGNNISLVSWTDLSFFPELEALKATSQDSQWHSEGNAFVHTDMVLAESVNVIPEIVGHCQNAANILRMSCLLHDIEKPQTTIFDSSIGHIIAPGHERLGGIISRYLLHETNIAPEDRRTISQLVATHHLVKRSAKNINIYKLDSIAFLERLAERVDTKLLWALEMANIKGRICQDRQQQIEYVELFQLFCEEIGVFGKKPTPWFDKRELNSIPFEDELVLDYALKETHRRRLTGQLSDPYQAKTFCWELAKRNSTPIEVIITVGVAGSGKSSAIEKLHDYTIISTDGIRKELYGDESIQGDVTVFQIAEKRLKEQLRKSWVEGGKVVYDATNVIPDFRKKIVDLCHDYGAYVSLWVFDISKEELKRRNKQRARQVPDEVIDKQCAKFEWVLPEEAHEIRIIDENS